jgi:hypothetical protein
MGGKHHKPPWWRRLGRQRQVEKPRPWMAEMVDGAGVAHWVSTDAYEQGLRERTGFYVVLCGRRIAAGSMAAPPERACGPVRRGPAKRQASRGWQGARDQV